SHASGTITTDGNLVLDITGTPSTDGTASFEVTIGGITETFTLTVEPAPIIATIRCSTSKPKFFGDNLVENVVIPNDNNTYIRVRYTGGNNKVFNSESISSTGVTGLTATVASGTLATGNGEVLFIISGTPSSSGTATFPISFLGVSNSSCQGGELDVTVDPAPVAINNLNCGSSSILNPNTIDLTDATTLTSGDNYQVRIPFTITSAGVHSAISISSTGVTGLTATAASGTITSDGNLDLTITGTPSGDGTASFALSLGGQSCSFDLTVTIAPTPTISNIRCSTSKPKFFGNTLVENTLVPNDNNTYIRVRYADGNGLAFGSESISSTGVTGLTATVAAGTLATGNGEVEFIISGTPSGSGTATFPISFLGVSNSSCQGGELDIPVSSAQLVLATLNVGSMSILNPNSIILDDTATLVSNNNYQVSIPFTVTNAGNHPAISVASTGVTGLTASHASGTITTDGNLVLDITGTPSTDGTASFEVTIGGITETFTLTVVPAPIIATIRCGTSKPKFFGNSLIDNSAVPNDNNTYIRVRYTSGNGKAFNSESITSTGVTGLTATVAAGTLATGNGEVLFIISGTPSGSGTATFPISFLGVSNSSCQGGVLAVPVDEAQLVVNNLNCGSSSILNPNTIDLTDATTLTSGDNYQVRIPFTITSAGVHSAISISSTGVTGLTATASAGTVTSNGNLDLDITGTPSSDGTASFALSYGGQSCTFTLTITTAPTPIITSIRCSTSKPKFFGNTLVENTLVPNDNNTYIRVRYAGGNGLAFGSESITSTGVTGLTATVAAGTLAIGNGEVLFIISGTPSGSGTATFPISFLGVSNTGCQGGELDVIVDAIPPIITGIRCSGNKPTYLGAAITEGDNILSSANNRIRVRYEGGNGADFSSESINSTGVTGLTATVASGSLANGNGEVLFIISGTPSSSGNAVFPISFLGVNSTCDDGNITLPIVSATPPALPSNITLTAGQKSYIASIYDTDYLPYTAPSGVAGTGALNAGNPSGEPTINVQGKLTTAGVTVRIPYVVTGGGSVTLQAFSQTRTVISAHVQGSAGASNNGGGNPVDVQFSYGTQTVSGTGFINAKIKSVGTTLKAVKLDINKGIGTDLGILLAEFTIATNSTGGTGNIQLKDIPGIPDRRFGEITTQGGVSGQFHNNLYLPIQATDGRIWLNNNLGANYADLSHDNFNPAQSALTKSDHNAYGSLYQWGRYSDGHELIDYTNGTTGTGVNGIIGGPIPTPTPNHNLFVKPSLNDWLSTVNNSLWQGVNGQNNPCPEGFRLPDNDEFSALMTALNFDNTGFSSSHVVKFPFPGFRVNISSTAGGINMESFQGYYQTSTVLSGGTTIRVHHLNEGHNMSQGAKKGGWSVRCIQD
ncbi:MAG: beta strand repeat-containing protein, partial [Flavobacteriales bacterium]